MSKVNFHNKNEGLKKSPLKILVACGPLNQKGADNKITISQTMEICTNSRKQHAQTSTEVGPDCMQVNDRRLPSNRFQQFGTLQTHSSRVANLNLFFFHRVHIDPQRGSTKQNIIYSLGQRYFLLPNQTISFEFVDSKEWF